MKCNTRDFGEIEINEKSIIDFIQPPFGFEAYKKFAVLYDEEVGMHIAWLQSLDESDICFILFDPSFLASFYHPEFSDDTLNSLGEGEIECWVIGVIPENTKGATINLKSPVLINTQTRQGAQVILEQDYPVRHPLSKEVE